MPEITRYGKHRAHWQENRPILYQELPGSNPGMAIQDTTFNRLQLSNIRRKLSRDTKAIRSGTLERVSQSLFDKPIEGYFDNKIIENGKCKTPQEYRAKIIWH